MERVKEYEKYWSFDEDYDISPYLECGSSLNSYHYEQGLYFRTKEEAESMARKLRAVLKGAEVIEMPSEEDITKQYAAMMIKHKEYDLYTSVQVHIRVIEWLKSKIVK